MIAHAHSFGPPPDAVGINWRSPQAKGLLLWYTPTLSRTIALRNHAPLGGFNLAPTNSPQIVTDQQMGLAARFDGASTQYCQVDAVPRNVYPMSLTCWVLGEDAGGASNQNAISLNSNNDSININLTLERTAVGQNVYFGVENNDDPNRLFIASSGTWTKNVWHLLIGVWETGSLAKLYIDGRQDGSDTGTVSAITALNRVSIGRLGRPTATDYLYGRIADARVYDRIITAQEARQMYDVGTRWDLYRTSRTRPVYAAASVPAVATPDHLRITQPHRRIIAAAPGPVAVW